MGRKGERRQETGNSFAEIGLAICDLEFGIWDFSHLAVLGELGGLIFQDQNKKNKTENGHWSLVTGY